MPLIDLHFKELEERSSGQGESAHLKPKPVLQSPQYEVFNTLRSSQQIIINEPYLSIPNDSVGQIIEFENC